MTDDELDAAALADELADAEQAERQAERGPFFPERGITAASLRDYAAKCRATADRYRDGGAHQAVLNPHTVQHRHADFIECSCGHLAVTESDFEQHVKYVKRRQRVAQA